jgi:hypothetical protein
MASSVLRESWPAEWDGWRPGLRCADSLSVQVVITTTPGISQRFPFHDCPSGDREPSCGRAGSRKATGLTRRIAEAELSHDCYCGPEARRHHSSIRVRRRKRGSVPQRRYVAWQLGMTVLAALYERMFLTCSLRDRHRRPVGGDICHCSGASRVQTRALSCAFTKWTWGGVRGPPLPRVDASARCLRVANARDDTRARACLCACVHT